MVLGLRDVTYEGGNDWPSMPVHAAKVVEERFSPAHDGSWRFLPSTIYGEPRPLKYES